MRNYDLTKINLGRKKFIKTREWEAEEAREYFFEGYEREEKTSQRTGNEYIVYNIYLKDDTDEYILQIFNSQATSLKNSGLKEHQKTKITKKELEKGEDYLFEAIPFDNEEINIEDIPF